MPLALSRFIEEDLDSIADYIAQDNPRRAVTFIREIRAKFREIQAHPLIYPLRPDIGQDARLVSFGNYAILFRIRETTVRIERVVYGGRDLAQLYPLQ